MKNAKLITDKIQSYLGELSPRAVHSLVNRLEKSQSEGGVDPNLDVILRASVGMIRGVKPVEPKEAPELSQRSVTFRKNQIQRLFFKPLDDFLLDETLQERQGGRIHRSMLNKVWAWLKRDILPDDISRVTSRAEDVSCSDEELAVELDNLQEKAVIAMRDALKAAEQADVSKRRLSVEMGGMRGLEEFQDIYRIFRLDADLNAFFEPYTEPLHPKQFKVETTLMKRVAEFLDSHPQETEILVAALLSRTNHAAALPALGMRLAGTDDLSDFAQTRYATFMSITLSEVERLAILAQEHRKYNPDPVGFSVALSDYHELIKALEVEFDFSQSKIWRDRLTAIKRNMSALVAKDLESVPGLLRRAIQVPPVDGEGNVRIDSEIADNAIRALRVFVMVRSASDTFAVNELNKRTKQAVEQMLEIMTRGLINELNVVSGPQKNAVLAAADNAIMLCELYYGGEYAAQLRRSRQAALGLPDGKPGKKTFGGISAKNSR